MTTREFAERLQEGTARYSLFSRSKEESGDLQNARIYSPTLDEVFGHGSFRNAYEAAELFQNELKSQGNRKTGENRGIYSLASNIFSAALGTETFDEPGVREEGKEHDPRLRNTAYAVINPRTGEEVNVKWDIPYPEQDLSDTNLEKYLADQEKFRKGQETYNTEDFKKKSEEEIEANSKKLGKAKRDALTPEILNAVKTTQDPENLKAYKDYATEWAKAKYPNVVEFVSDTLKGSKENIREDIWHIDWAGEINSGNNTDIGNLFLNWLNNQLDLAQRASSNFEQDEKTYNRLIQKFEAANNTIALKNMEHNVEQLKKEKEKNKKEKEDLKKAMAYAEAVNNLWSIGSGRVMKKIADPDKRETFKLK